MVDMKFSDKALCYRSRLLFARNISDQVKSNSKVECTCHLMKICKILVQMSAVSMKGVKLLVRTFLDACESFHRTESVFFRSTGVSRPVFAGRPTGQTLAGRDDRLTVLGRPGSTVFFRSTGLAGRPTGRPRPVDRPADHRSTGRPGDLHGWLPGPVDRI